jgi:hypothetical protein
MLHPLIATTEEWGGDEVMLLIVSGAATAFATWWLVQSMIAVPRFGRRPVVRTPLLATILACFAVLLAVTWQWTAVEIRGGQAYTWLAMFMGGGWFAIYARLFRWLGIGLREDVCERTNPAALRTVCGAIIGGMLLYCGSICGEGPSFWNNVFTVLASGGAWFLLWILFEKLTAISRSVSEDRDVAAGSRFGGLLIATGLIIGRAAAGNWEAWQATIIDLVRDSWPAIPLVLAAALVERFGGRASHGPGVSFPMLGVPVAILYLAAATAWVLHLGWWEGYPG